MGDYYLILFIVESGFKGPFLTQVSLFHQPHPLLSHVHNLGIASNTNAQMISSWICSMNYLHWNLVVHVCAPRKFFDLKMIFFFPRSVCLRSRDLSKDWAGKMLEAVKIDTGSQRKNRVDDTNAEWRTWHSSIVSERRSTVHYCWWQNWHKATAYSNERVNGCTGRSLEVKLAGWIKPIYSSLELHFLQMQFLNCCLS